MEVARKVLKKYILKYFDSSLHLHPESLLFDMTLWDTVSKESESSYGHMNRSSWIVLESISRLIAEHGSSEDDVR